MKTAIGGDRLGSGNKQDVKLSNYGRSSHDIGYTWRSTMSAGTLVPFWVREGLPGDSFDVTLNCEVMTLPTRGPLFGSYKVQLDVFVCPIRLYNARLHMNEIGLGMVMKDVKLPAVVVQATKLGDASNYLDNNWQVSPSSLFKYLGLSGIGNPRGTKETYARAINAVPFLAYWDIYKQYYANKMEEEGVCIHHDANKFSYTPIGAWINSVYDFGFGLNVLGLDNQTPPLPLGITKLSIQYGPGTPEMDPEQVTVNVNAATQVLTDVFDTFRWNREDGVLIATGYTGPEILSFFVPEVATSPRYPSLDQTISLRRFPLKNIDDMRKNILRWPNDTSPYSIGFSAPEPYALHRTDVQTELGNRFSLAFSQEQLAVKTYQSDLFNNWISTEWIDGPNGINEITSVDTTGDSFTIDALNLAKKVYVMLNRIAISGGTYDDWLDAVYTHERTKGVENPVYQGSLIRELAFQEITSNAETLNQNGTILPLGTLAGKGRLTDKNKGGRMKIRIDEPSFVMGIVSITPRIDYSQGNEWFIDLKTLDDFHKPALDAIGYQDLLAGQLAWQNEYIDENDEISYFSVGKQPAWINYMTAVNKCYGNFAIENSDMFMTLNRRYDIDVDGITDLTTYIDPSKFNFIFAQTDLSSQNFWVQIRNDVTARRKMSAKVIPNL